MVSFFKNEFRYLDKKQAEKVMSAAIAPIHYLAFGTGLCLQKTPAAYASAENFRLWQGRNYV
ncbi:hypothetical protein K7I13_06990 [Brucepastera parasyntrophica]|uniref:hypothetical protein n=1 Tax=Brucepastera parasyntrophica TaxID=2880008 RepID=UPI00210D29EB|nr:hypothetical protein [Brucepastera parasyntrophica]ULQ60992.1 hypothetical protein K7I13_06990 [Brucepastera parasyntrophica]